MLEEHRRPLQPSAVRPHDGHRPRVALVTNMPSYHNIDLFNAIAAQGSVELRVFYLRKITPGRQWTRFGRELRHDHVFVPEVAVHPYFYLNRGFVSALRAFGADMYIVTQYASIAMQGLMYAATALRRPWVFWSERAGQEFTEHKIVDREWLRVALRKVATLPLHVGPREMWGIGRTATEYYGERFGHPTHNMPYYADLERFWTIERTPAPAERVRLLYMGKFNERKGFDLVLGALERLLDDATMRERFTLDLIGDGPLREGLERLVAAHPEQVRYHGFVEIDEVPAFLAPADVLVAPSRFDGWGMMVTEAMAAGVPVISTVSASSARDTIEHDVNGWLVEPGSQAALEATLRRAIDAHASLPAMSQRAREASRRYDSQVGAERFAERIATVLGRR